MIKFEVIPGVCCNFSRPNELSQRNLNSFLTSFVGNNKNIVELCLTNTLHKKKNRGVYVR